MLSLLNIPFYEGLKALPSGQTRQIWGRECPGKGPWHEGLVTRDDKRFNIKYTDGTESDYTFSGEEFDAEPGRWLKFAIEAEYFVADKPEEQGDGAENIPEEKPQENEDADAEKIASSLVLVLLLLSTSSYMLRLALHA